MGSFFAKALSKIVAKQEIRILLLGLDAAGKTTMLYKLSSMKNVEFKVYPSFCFNVETLFFENYSVSCWDLDGQDKLRPLYKHYYQGTDGIIYVVDSNDRERLSDIFSDNERINLLTFGYIKKSLNQFNESNDNDQHKNLKMKWPVDITSIIFNYTQCCNDHIVYSAKYELDLLLVEEELQGVPLLVFANKQDLPNAASINEITNELGLNKILQKDRKWHIEASIATRGDGINKGLNWLNNAMSK